MRGLRRRLVRRAAISLGVLLGAVTPALAFDDSALARQAYDKIILPGYARFASSAQALADEAKTLCTNPSEEALSATRTAARTALLAWGRIEPLRFGPITLKQRADRLLFYPDAHGIVAKQTAKLLARRDDADIDPDKLAGASVAVQGFGALDIALFGGGAEALATPEGDFRCRYVRALALDIAVTARDVYGEWQGEFGRLWLQPGTDNRTFLTPKETTQALYRAYVTQLEVLRLQRLATLDGASAKPGTPLLPNSRLALPFILAGIEGQRDIVGEGGFLADDLASTDVESGAIAILGSVATDLGFAMRAGEAALAMAPDPLSDPAARARLTPMLLSLKNAETVGRAALGELTGQALGFNSLDGD